MLVYSKINRKFVSKKLEIFEYAVIQLEKFKDPTFGLPLDFARCIQRHITLFKNGTNTSQFHYFIRKFDDMCKRHNS